MLGRPGSGGMSKRQFAALCVTAVTLSILAAEINVITEQPASPTRTVIGTEVPGNSRHYPVLPPDLQIYTGTPNPPLQNGTRP